MANRRGAAQAARTDRIAARDRRVKRIHIANGAHTLCNRDRADGDIPITTHGHLGTNAEPLPSNTCSRCRAIWFR